MTIRPSWGLRELSKFLTNFDTNRVTNYMLDGERATWPHLELIHSLCEIEFCLDEVAANLQHSMAVARSAASAASAHAAATHAPSAANGANGANANSNGASMLAPGSDVAAATTPSLARNNSSMGGFTRGKLPSYVSLATYGDNPRGAAYPVDGVAGGATDAGAGAMRPTRTYSGSAPVFSSGRTYSGSSQSLGGLPGVASSASMLNLAELDTSEDEAHPAMGMSPFL